ncbi:MAG: M14 family metallocarboxypeptidase [Nitrospinaceae bacterium]
MRTKNARNYESVVTRLERSLDGQGTLISLGEVSTPGRVHSLKKIVLGKGHPRKVLISAGIHGDEPAGVETLCAWIEREEYKPYLKNWEFTLIPCINPFGYEHGVRHNHENKDLNRHFKSSPPPAEVWIVQTVFQSPFDLTLELHEDVDSPGFYLYQTAQPSLNQALGIKIVEEVQKTMPVNPNSRIEGMPARKGIIDRLSDPESMPWWPMALYALSSGARYCLTLETASRFPLETRVQAHLGAIRAALDHFSDC